VEYLWNVTDGKSEILGRKPSSPLPHHKSHMDGPGIEPGLPWREICILNEML